MQAIKYIDIPANGADEVKRPTIYPNGGGSAAIIKDDSDLLNTEIATFLSDCGVDAYFGVKEGEEYEWLWINDMPLYFYTKPTDSYPVIRVYVPGGSSVKTINSSEIPDNRLVFNFCGNPDGAFLFRFFTTTFSLYYMFTFTKIRSLLSNKVYPSVRVTSGGSSSVVLIHTFVNESRTKEYTVSTTMSLLNSAKPFLADDIGEDKLALIPMESITDVNASVNVPSILVLEGVYLYPVNTSIPDGSPFDSLYQTEIFIDSRKFLVGYASTTAVSSSTIRLGLVALEDDDPLISEDDLLSEVET